MMRKPSIKYYLLLTISLLLMISCKKNKESIFTVYNYGGQSIDINYHDYEIDSNLLATIPAYDTDVLFTSIPSNEEGYNWYYDFDIFIYSITNASGDTLKFNPNLSLYWHRSGADSKYYYSLDIGDWSF